MPRHIRYADAPETPHQQGNTRPVGQRAFRWPVLVSWGARVGGYSSSRELEAQLFSLLPFSVFGLYAKGGIVLRWFVCQRWKFFFLFFGLSLEEDGKKFMEGE
jgi:hypothetical protein